MKNDRRSCQRRALAGPTFATRAVILFALNILTFAARLTSDLRAICDDKHLAVRPGAPPREPGNAARRGVDNYGFSKIEILPGNIGYLKLNAFDPSDEALDVAAAAMKFLENTQALVFDLRDNGGGSPRMIAFLSSYLFDEEVAATAALEKAVDLARAQLGPAREQVRRVRVPAGP